MERKYNRLECCLMLAMMASLGCHQLGPLASLGGEESDDAGIPGTTEEDESDNDWEKGELQCSVEHQISLMGSKLFHIAEAEGVETLFTALPHSYLRLIGEDEDGEKVQVSLSYDSFVVIPSNLGLGESFTVDLNTALKDGSMKDLVCSLEWPENESSSVFNMTNSQFRGEIRISPLSGRPGNYLELCIIVQPHHMSMDPYLVFHAKPFYMRPEFPCQPGLDQTCNESLEVSALRGICDDDGFCTCHPPATKTPSGKCALEGE